MEVDAEVLISLIEANPVLWDKTLKTHKDRISTKNAWRDVCLALKPDFESISDTEKNAFGKEVIRRWTNLRDCYAKSKRDEKATKKSGPELKKRKKYVYSKQLQFLNKLYDNHNRIDNMVSEIEEGLEKLENAFAEDEEPRDTAEDVLLPNRTAVNVLSNQTRARKPKKTDEIELKPLEPVTPYSKMSFLQSLMPHLKLYMHEEFLHFQMGVLNVIQNINKRKEVILQPQTNYSSHMPSCHPGSAYMPRPPSVIQHQSFLPAQQPSDNVNLVKAKTSVETVSDDIEDWTENTDDEKSGCSTVSQTPSSKKSLKRQRGNISVEDYTVTKSLQNRVQERDEFAIYAEHVACKLRKLATPHAQIMAQYHINQILHLAELGNYNSPAPEQSSSSSTGIICSNPEKQPETNISNDSYHDYPEDIKVEKMFYE